MAKYKCPFEPNQLVKFIAPIGFEEDYPFKKGEILLFLGEIKQMPRHCIIVNRLGKVFYGYHTDDFVEPEEDEI